MTLSRAIPVWNWRKAAALCVALSLFVLALFAPVLLHPVSPHASVLAFLILLPVVLFGLVVVPRSLWPAADLDPLLPVTPRARASLFQRPPPQSLR